MFNVLAAISLMGALLSVSGGEKSQLFFLRVSIAMIGVGLLTRMVVSATRAYNHHFSYAYFEQFSGMLISVGGRVLAMAFNPANAQIRMQPQPQILIREVSFQTVCLAEIAFRIQGEFEQTSRSFCHELPFNVVPHAREICWDGARSDELRAVRRIRSDGAR
jgi:hypothetical protein